MSICEEAYDPPDTTGAGDDCPAEEAEGVCDGCCKALPELAPLFEPELAELEDEDDGWLVELVVDAACPRKDLAAASEIAPLATTAPAIIHRLTREIRASPACRALVALGFTITMIGPRRKKLLSRR